jgi:hypothetical protein
VIILDHNITEDQAQLLRQWRIHFRQSGVDVGRPEWADLQEILRYLRRHQQLTFITRDFDFFPAASLSRKACPGGGRCSGAGNGCHQQTVSAAS